MSQPAIEVEGGFADLGLESPDVQLPSYGVPVGTWKAFVSNARFVQKKDDPNKRNLEITYKVNQPGEKIHDLEVRETKAANATDSAQTKGFLLDRLMSLGVERDRIPQLNVKSLIGTPVYIRMVEQRDSQWNKLARVTLDTDAEHVDYTPPSDPTGVGGNNVQQPKAVSASDITY